MRCGVHMCPHTVHSMLGHPCGHTEGTGCLLGAIFLRPKEDWGKDLHSCLEQCLARQSQTWSPACCLPAHVHLPYMQWLQIRAPVDHVPCCPSPVTLSITSRHLSDALLPVTCHSHVHAMLSITCHIIHLMSHCPSRVMLSNPCHLVGHMPHCKRNALDVYPDFRRINDSPAGTSSSLKSSTPLPFTADLPPASGVCVTQEPALLVLGLRSWPWHGMPSLELQNAGTLHAGSLGGQWSLGAPDLSSPAHGLPAGRGNVGAVTAS